MSADLIERLNDVLDIIVAAEQQFARTEAHHAYYGDRFAAVQKAVEDLSAASAIALAWRLHSKEDETREVEALRLANWHLESLPNLAGVLVWRAEALRSAGCELDASLVETAAGALRNARCWLCEKCQTKLDQDDDVPMRENGVVITDDIAAPEPWEDRCAHGVQRFLVCEKCHVTQDKNADLQTPRLVGDGQLALLRGMLDQEIEREGEMHSFMVKAGLLKAIIVELQRARERIQEFWFGGDND